MRAEVEQAAELAQRGDADAMVKAVALLQGTVFSFSMKVCGHREDAEDTMQETLLRVSPMLKKISNPKALAVWLYKVARSRCLMSRRRSRFAAQPDLSLEALMPEHEDLKALAVDREKDPDPERSLLKRESEASLRAAIDKLPAEYRLILVLHDMEELSTEEVAKISGLKPGTVRVRLHRARLFLRNQLSAVSPKKRKVTRRARRCREMFSVLSDFIDEQLPPDMCEQLEAHMEGCRPCETFLESLRQTVARCRDFQPDGCAARVKRLIEQYRKTAAQ